MVVAPGRGSPHLMVGTQHRETRKGETLNIHFKGMPTTNLSFSHEAPLLEGSTHYFPIVPHTGDQAFNTWAFGGHLSKP
jgi:hypothetical protein